MLYKADKPIADLIIGTHLYSLPWPDQFTHQALIDYRL